MLSWQLLLFGCLLLPNRLFETLFVLKSHHSDINQVWSFKCITSSLHNVFFPFQLYFIVVSKGCQGVLFLYFLCVVLILVYCLLEVCIIHVSLKSVAYVFPVIFMWKNLKKEAVRRSMAAGERELFCELNVEPEGACEPGFQDYLLFQQLMENKDRPSPSNMCRRLVPRAQE